MKDAPLSSSILCRLAALLTVACAWPTVSANPLPSDWKEWQGVHYRIEADGNFSCYSEGEHRCQSGTPSTDPRKVKPLVCGSALQTVGPTSGYEESGHWCNVAYANLFAEWHDYSLLGHRGMLSKNARGDTMCRAFDSTNCDRYDPGPEEFDIAGATAMSPFQPTGHGGLWVRKLELNGTTLPVLRRDVHAPPTGDREIRPLVCGAAHARQHGHPGYDAPGHWCDTPEIVAQWIHPPTADGASSNPGHEQSRELLRTYRLPLPAWTPQEQPLWVARIHSEHSHEQALVGIEHKDEWLALTIPKHFQSESTQLSGDTSQAMGAYKRSKLGWSTVAFRVDQGAKVQVVQGAGRAAPLQPMAGTAVPESHTSSAIVGFPADWNMASPAMRDFTFQLYVDASRDGGVWVHNMTVLDEVIMARKRVRPVD